MKGKKIMLNNKIRKLSKRESEIIQLKIQGLYDKEIAHQLGISYGTVRNHITKAKLKFACSNIAQLAFVLKDAGLIKADYIN